MASKQLSDKQKAFVFEYCSNGHNASAAYKIAYPASSAKASESNGIRAIRNDRIKKAIMGHMAELQVESSYTIEQYQLELESVRIRAELLKQPSAEVSAIVAKGRSMGYDKSNDIGAESPPKALDEPTMAKLIAMNKVVTASELSGTGTIKLFKEA